MDHMELKRKPSKLMAAIAGIVMTASSGVALAVTDANKVDLDFEMQCSFPLVGATPIHVTGEAAVPAVVKAGQPLPNVTIDFTATLTAQTIGGLNVVQLGYLGGKVEVDIDVDQPQTTLPITLTIPIEKAPIPSVIADYPLVSGNGKAPELSFRQGPVEVYINGIRTEIEGFERDGSPANGGFELFIDDCDMERYLVRKVQVAPPVGPGIAFSTTSVDFGKVAPGTSDTTEITVGNTGTTTLMFDSISFEGNRFSGSEDCLGSSLAPGETCTIDATYSAGNSGTQTGSITVVSDAGTKTITLSGTASSSGTIEVAEKVSFGVAAIGQTRTKEVSISNTGNDSLNINGISISGDSDFVLTGNDCGILAPTESCAATVSLTASSESAKSATLTVKSNDPDNGSVDIALSATTAAMTGTGETKKYIALTGEGQVKINAVSSGKADLKGFFDGTIDRADGGIDFDMELDDTTAKLTGLGILPLLINMQFVQTRPIVGTFVNSEMEFTAYLDVFLKAIKINFFGIGLPIAGGKSCQIAKEREIPFVSVGKVNLAGGLTPINGPLYLGNVEKCGFLNVFVNAFVINLGKSPIDLDLKFVDPAL